MRPVKIDGCEFIFTKHALTRGWQRFRASHKKLKTRLLVAVGCPEHRTALDDLGLYRACYIWDSKGIVFVVKRTMEKRYVVLTIKYRFIH